MKAIMCRAYGAPDSLTLEDIPSPKAGPGEVVAKVHACALNFPDLLVIANKYQFPAKLPFTPGGEICATVTQVGEGVATLSPGDKVICSSGTGGFAEEILIDKDRLGRVVKLPAKVTDNAAAASFLTAYTTSYHALKDRARIKRGETLVVLGAAGGVGLAAVELGKMMGARVIAAASTAEKLALCRDYGADEGINYNSEDLKGRIKALTGGNGADVIYDAVGDKYAEPALRAMAWNGRFLVVGFAGGEIPKIPLNLTLLKGCSLVGVFHGVFAQKEPAAAAQNIRELITFLAEGRLKPFVQRRYRLDQTIEALNDMAARKVMGKIVVEPGA
jgi:NADPH2:quinone reductase